MADENGVQTQAAKPTEDLIIVSDTTRRIMDVRKTLADMARSKDVPAAQKYHCRRAVEALDRLIAEAVSG